MPRSNGCLLPQLAVEACRKTEPGWSSLVQRCSAIPAITARP